MNSMTGYGRGESELGGVTVVAELRSVNSRFRDLNYRGPREYAAFETLVKAELKARFTRGRLDLTLNRESASSGGRVRLDRPLAAQYHAALTELAALVGDGAPVPLAAVAQLPGVLKLAEADVDIEAEWPAVAAALAGACEAMAVMRAAEGEALKADLRLHLDRLSALCSQAEAAADIGERLTARLAERLEKLIGAAMDPQRLLQEAAALVDRADVSEELARLSSHLVQINAALELDESVGRRLDFLCQEVHREINTCGSKSAGVDLSELVVEMKSTLERIREQVANVE